MQDHHHAAEEKPLNLTDVVAAAVLFWLITALLGKYLGTGPDAVIRGLLKPETLTQVRLSGAIFIAFWAVAGNLLLRPFIELTLERQEKTVGASIAAAEKLRESRDILQRIEAELQEARLLAMRERDALADAAKKEAQRRLEAALSAADEQRRTAQAQIAMLKAETQRELSGEADKLAGLVVERALSPAKPNFMQ